MNVSVPSRGAWLRVLCLTVGQLALTACSLWQPPVGGTGASPAVTVGVVALDLAFDTPALRLPSGVPVAIVLDNRDPGILHNVSIMSAEGSLLFRGATFAGVEKRTYRIAPLPVGAFRFVCDVHPEMAGELAVVMEQ